MPRGECVVLRIQWKGRDNEEEEKEEMRPWCKIKLTMYNISNYKVFLTHSSLFLLKKEILETNLGNISLSYIPKLWFLWILNERRGRQEKDRKQIRVCSIMCAATLNKMVVSCSVCQLMSFLLKMRGSERTTTSPRLSLWYSPPCLRAKSTPHFSLHKQGVKQVSGKRTTPFLKPWFLQWSN